MMVYIREVNWRFLRQLGCKEIVSYTGFIYSYMALLCERLFIVTATVFLQLSR